jgi:hypothetical protein
MKSRLLILVIKKKRKYGEGVCLIKHQVIKTYERVELYLHSS